MCKCTWVFSSIKQFHFLLLVFSPFWGKNFLVGLQRKHPSPTIYFSSSPPNQTHSKKVFLPIFFPKFSIHPISPLNKHILRASAPIFVYSYIIEKELNFTHLSHKTSHISPSKIVYIYTFATIIVHIYTITVTVHTIILLISQFPTFFLSLLCVQNELNLRLLLSSSSFSSDTHKHIHTDKSTQRYTNTPIWTN